MTGSLNLAVGFIEARVLDILAPFWVYKHYETYKHFSKTVAQQPPFKII